MNDEYLLHFVGSHLYGRKAFVREAEKYGVNRRVPFGMLKNLKFGQVVLLAEYQKADGEDFAAIFGYFRIDAITERLPDDVRAELMKRLDIVSVVSDIPKHVSRGCGSYTIVGEVYIRDSIESLSGKIEASCETAGVNVNDCLFFLKGEFVELEQPYLMRGRKFFRGYCKVSLPIEIERPHRKQKRGVVFIKDYENNWSEKIAHDRLDNTVLEEWMAN